MSDGFPTTRWSCVIALQGEDESVRWRALNQLLEMYRPALLHFLVTTQRMPKERAEDLVQSFITDQILKSSLLLKAKSDRGKLRSLLLKSFSNYLASEHRKDVSKKRSPSAGAILSLDEVPERSLAESTNMAKLDEAWAKQALTLALDTFKATCIKNKRMDWWDVFEARVLVPSLGEGCMRSFNELAERHGFVKPQDASNALVSAKRAFGRILRDIIAETVNDRSCIDEEIQTMIMSLSR